VNVGGAIGRALGWLDAVENALIALFAIALVLLAGTQIVLRLSNHGLVWLDPVLRVLVIWAALLGAVAAARHDKHIKFDVVGRLLRGRALMATRIVTMLFASAICMLMVKSSLSLIELDRDSGAELFGSVPMWWAELILPVAFGLLALRFFLRAFSPPSREPGP
jgi:TRAP-type C4-dicarboxylate transport system permease small subunit